MNPLIEQHREELWALARRYHVRRLDLFGSAARDDFHEASDLDFVVEFEDLGQDQYADHYFGLREALIDLFDRPVDLLMASAIDNPYFIEKMNASRVAIYGD